MDERKKQERNYSDILIALDPKIGLSEGAEERWKKNLK